MSECRWRGKPILTLLRALALWLGVAGSSQAQTAPHIILVHGLWALPESLVELGDNLATLGYHVHYIKYAFPKTCRQLGDTVREQFDHIMVEEHLDARSTYAYGYSLGGMAIALADINIDGIILDAPANYSTLACRDLTQFEPDSPGYEHGTKWWRWNSDNRSPAVDQFAVSKARILVIGHLDDDVIPQQTITAYARAPFASISWVPGSHVPVWSAVAMSIDQFVQLGMTYSISSQR